MTTSQLQIALASLHESLDDRTELEPELHPAARQVVHDLVRLLSTTSADEADPPTSQNLRDMLLHYEAEHPQVARVLGQIADGLQNLGI
jgi:hypothetical protein